MMKLADLCTQAASRHVVDDVGAVVATTSLKPEVPTLSDSIAIALPDSCERLLLAQALQEARDGRLQVEIRIGVGPLSQGLPLRVVGHAGLLARTLQEDALKIVPRVSRIHIFSSAPKTVDFDEADACRSIAVLACALRLAGVTVPIKLDTACPTLEVADRGVTFPSALVRWLEDAARRSKNGVGARRYALEHCAPSMFGDFLGHAEDRVLRITVGSAPEARFWAARRLVRACAAVHKGELAPALGLIIKSARIPWYTRSSGEPLLEDFDVSTLSSSLRLLDVAANPQHGGNGGLRGEVLMASRMLKPLANSRTTIPVRGVAGLPAIDLLSWAANDPDAVEDLAARNLFQLGHRMKAMVQACRTEHSSS